LIKIIELIIIPSPYIFWFNDRKNIWTGYDYKFNDLYQTSYVNARIIGDKKGGKSSLHFYFNPSLVKHRFFTRNPVKFILIVRNPYDNIATMAKKDFESLDSAIDIYKKKCEGCQILLESNALVHIARYEELIYSTTLFLQDLFDFLELKLNEGFITSIHSKLFKEPNKARNTVKWNKDQLDRVANLIKQFQFLNSYSFDP
jgi:hypothetical protein